MNTTTTESVQNLITRLKTSPRAMLALRDIYVELSLDGASGASDLVHTLTDIICGRTSR